MSSRCARFTDTLEPGTGLRRQCANTVASGDWCRRCSGFKSPKPPKAARTTATTAPARPPVPAQAADLEPVTAAEVGQCQAMVNDVRKEAKTGAQVQCRQAVRLPETHCYRHGGDPAQALGKTFAKATAEAGRGELTLAGEDYRRGHEFRRGTYERLITDMMATDPSRLAAIAAAASKYQRTHGASRWKGQMNRLGAYVTLHRRGQRLGLEGEELAAYVGARIRMPIHTEADWKKLGRTVVESEKDNAILVSYSSFGAKTVTRKDGESLEDYEERKRQAGRPVTSRLYDEYLLEQTTGKPWTEPAPDPLDTPQPRGYGDPVATYAAVTDYAQSLGITVHETAARPASGAYAFYRPSDNSITIWTGIAGGDPTARLHSMLHELGHARDTAGPRPCQHGDANYARGELVAETYAYLAMAHFGVDTAELSKLYIGDERSGWGSRLGADFTQASYSAFATAMVTVDQLVTALTPEGEKAA